MNRLAPLLFLTLVTGCAGGSALTGDDSQPGSNYAGPPGPDGGGVGTGSGVTDPTEPVYPTAHPRIYLGPNAARLETSLAAHGPEATRFKSVVDAWVGGANTWGFQVWNAALVGQLTGQPQYCTAAVASVDAQVTAAEAAIAAGGVPVVAGDSYLDVGDYLGDLALTYDWCFDQVTATQKTRWLAYADQAIANVWDHDHATWGGHAAAWSGWATDDPGDNYYYSFLRATMLVGLATKGEDPKADGWLDQFRTTKIENELQPTFTADLVGGGSREGTGYGIAMKRLWELYDIWQATTGETLATQTLQTRASMMSFIHQTLPTLDRVAPTGDQSRDSTATFFDYHRQYLAELIALFPTDAVASRAAYLLASCSVPQMAQPFMAAYDFLYAPTVAPQPFTGMNTAYYAPGIGELYARSGWDTHATWVNLVAGPYTQSHAHQDQGALMLYKDGWLAYDSVIDSQSGLRQETSAHGLVRIDRGGAPIKQVASTTSKLVGLQQGAGWLYASADLTPAYAGDAAIGKVQRELVFLMPDVVVVYDRVTSDAGTEQTWQLASPVSPSISGPTATFTTAGHALHVQRLAPASATASAFAYTSDASGDYKGGFRLDEAVPGGDQRYLHVLSIDGAATSATAQGDNGVTIVLADGRTAVIAFQRDTAGASLTLAGATTVLDATVTPLAE